MEQGGSADIHAADDKGGNQKSVSNQKNASRFIVHINDKNCKLSVEFM